MNMIAGLGLLGWVFLVSLLLGATPADAGDCYQHQSNQQILRDCSGDTDITCKISEDESVEIKANRKANWTKLASGAPGCPKEKLETKHMKDAPPIRGDGKDTTKIKDDVW